MNVCVVNDGELTIISKKEYITEVNNEWKRRKYESDPEWRRMHISRVIEARRLKKKKLQEEKPVFRIDCRQADGTMKTVFEQYVKPEKAIETKTETETKKTEEETTTRQPRFSYGLYNDKAIETNQEQSE